MPIVTKSQLKLIHSMISPRRVTLVGLDVGTTNVGVALSDPSLKVALPQTTLHRKECVSPPETNPLYQLLRYNNSFGMIVGFPYLLDGSESVQCEDVKLFIHDFLVNTKVEMPIVLENELYTSQAAMAEYAGKGKKAWNEGLRRKDKVAAAIILQDFLDSFNQA